MDSEPGAFKVCSCLPAHHPPHEVSRQGAAMRLVKFEQIDEQGKRERDIYINPEQVRSIIALPDYGKNKRTRIAFSADDNVLVRGTADEIWAMLEGREPPAASPAPLPRD
jgi:hypothetical protein